MKRVLSGFLVSVWVVQLLFAAPASQSRTNRMGRLSAMVLDINDSRVAGAKVTIEARAFKRELSTTPEGTLRSELPAGDYDLTVDANGFCKFQGPLTIKAGVTEMVNIHLEVAVYDSPDACKCTLRSVRSTP